MLTLTALVVDDSRVMRTMVMQALRRAGLAEFEFVEAEDGADALDKFDPRTVDICFVDWNMPVMTGIEFVRRARALGTNRHVPMVLVTSESTVSRIEEALTDAGANAYVCKPFTAEDLVVKLQPIVDRLTAMRMAAARGSWFAKLFA